MKRKKRKTRRAVAKAADAAPRSAIGVLRAAGTRRRAVLLKLRNGLIAFAVVGSVGWHLAEEVRATAREHDLSQLGNGTAAVVQIHDPRCSTCKALQRETRIAINAFDPSEIQYLVANIRTSEGRTFARTHRVGHVTLLLFDGNGKRRDTLVGLNTAKKLERLFRRHVKMSAGG